VAAGLPTMLTANAGPGLLSQLSHRLASRLAAGLTVGVDALHPAGRLALLLEKAQRRQLAVSQDVLAWLARHLTGGARQVDGALAQLETLARMQRQPLDVSAVAAYFRDQVEQARPTIDRIAQRVAGCFAIEPRQLQSRRRSRKFLVPRQVGMYIARQVTSLSLGEIGHYFGGRDHSTVLHACRKVEQELTHDAALAGAVKQLQADLQ
jgi:chromosomal replication initiator protein